jgi:zona occludens toxin (predicted ATPase)
MSRGNRKDLHILRIEKNSVEGNIQKIDTISFSYSNQTDFTKLKSNTTNFDCEAFVVVDDSIYLFTKQWKQKNISIYHPKTPGNYRAQLKDSFNVKG